MSVHHGRRRRRWAGSIRALAVGFLVGATARADVIVVGDREIDGVQVQTIRSGRVYYLDRTNELKQAAVEDVRAILFDNIYELGDARRYEARGDLEDALDKLLVAMTKAENQPQRLWVHARLAAVHNKLGDVIEAAGHFGAVVDMDASAAWLRFMPQGELNEASFYSAGEATWYLKRAIRRVRAGELADAVQSLLRQIEPVFDALDEGDLREYHGGATISGILLRDIGKPRPRRTRPEANDDPGAADTDPGEIDPAADSPEAIDRLLEEGRHGEAVRLCARLARRPGDRELARYLYQYGRALTGAGRPRDGAVKFARAAIEFPGAPYAPQSWIELAIIYDTVYDKPAKARELLELAATTAAELGELDIANLARQRLQELGN